MMSDVVTVRAHLEAWLNDSTVEVDDSPVEFTVPVADATYPNGEWIPDKCRDSDLLREHENAPNRVQRWQGPFWIEILQETAGDAE